jgi:type I restriction enzyme R subunit
VVAERSGSEFEDVQKPAFELLQKHFGYRYVRGEDLGDVRESASDIILTDVLAENLKKINPGITENGIRDAIDALRQPLAKNLLEANEACYLTLSRWKTVDEFRDGKPTTRNVRYFNFEEPQKNDFLIVDELEVKGPRKTRRLDLVIFVNGIPLVVMECKNPGDADGIAQAVQDLRDYQDANEGVARLFHTVLLTVALQRHDAQYGTIGTPLQRYAQWKSVYPRSKFDLERMLERNPTPQDVLVAGMLAPENLVDLLRNFVVFDRDDGKVVKKLARYQQFEAVNQTLRRVISNKVAPERKDRGGIIWHTQGSGKSLTMLWLCLKLRREPLLENPTLLIVTDRTDLDRQITQTFINCGFENPVRASRVQHLRKLLQGPTGQTVMTTVQKFRDEVDALLSESDPQTVSKVEKLFRERLGEAIVDEALKQREPVLNEADNVFVLIDEAHRTEYGRFNANMRRTLPNSCLLGFTGTPIPKSLLHFGPYIHKYTMLQAVKDDATVNILYESREASLAIWGNEIDVEFELEFEELSDQQRNKLKQRALKLGERRSRIAEIAKDIVKHYRANFERDGFKAQIAVSSQAAAAIYFEELHRHLGVGPDGNPRVAVMISGTQDKNSPLNELRDRFQPEADWIEKFKTGSTDELAMLLVVDKYLTGFDAPILRCLYLDKPLQDHALLQAIARVNRPMPEKGKEWGLVVDYWGVARHLDKALATLTVDIDIDDVMRRRNDEASLAALRQTRTDVFALFPDGLDRHEIEPWLLVLDKEDIRAVFHARYKAFYQALERLLPAPEALDFIADFSWMKKIRDEARVFYQEVDDSLPAAFSQRVGQLVDKHLKAEGVDVLLKPVSILDDEFTGELDKLKSEHAKASRMEHALKKTITIKLHEDPVFYMSLKTRLEEVIEDRRLSRIDDVQRLQALTTIREHLRGGQSESAESLGLNSDSYAVYGLLNRRYAEAGEDIAQEQVAELADSVYDMLKEEAVIDWVNKEDVQREMRRKVKRQLRLARCPKDQIEPVTGEIMDWARVQLDQ